MKRMVFHSPPSPLGIFLYMEVRILAGRTKEKNTLDRINYEKKRLAGILGDLDGKKKKTVEGLIENAAFMRVTLKDLSKDLAKNGVTEKFQQGNQPAYMRKRPEAEIYNNYITNYNKTIKQLTDLLPDDTQKSKELEDGFDEFVAGREEI